MNLDLAELAGSPILTGAPSGRALFSKLLHAVSQEPQSTTQLFLDFSNVQVATSSFLRESVLELRAYLRGRRSKFYPVITNANSDVRDEIYEIAQTRGGVFQICKVSDTGEILRCQLSGNLEPAQKVTYDLLCELGTANARDLKERANDSISINAWNNRLSALSNLGIVAELSVGRSKTYSPIVSGV